MNSKLQYTSFVVKAFPSRGDRPRELTRTMAPHPLSFQELPYDPEYTLYNKRLTPESLNHMTDDEMYFIMNAIEDVAKNHKEIGADYTYNNQTNEFVYKDKSFSEMNGERAKRWFEL